MDACELLNKYFAVLRFSDIVVNFLTNAVITLLSVEGRA